MKKLLLVLLFVFLPAVSYSAYDCSRINEMKEEQIDFIKQAYEYGEPHDLGYSMAAIGWKESKAGKYNINVQDPSFGPWHVTLPNALYFMGWKDTKFNRNRVAQLMIDDISLSAQMALTVLKFWRKQYENDWIMVWASYNAGWNYMYGLDYAYDIRYRIRIIDQCIDLKPTE